MTTKKTKKSIDDLKHQKVDGKHVKGGGSGTGTPVQQCPPGFVLNTKTMRCDPIKA